MLLLFSQQAPGRYYRIRLWIMETVSSVRVLFPVIFSSSSDRVMVFRWSRRLWHVSSTVWGWGTQWTSGLTPVKSETEVGVSGEKLPPVDCQAKILGAVGTLCGPWARWTLPRELSAKDWGHASSERLELPHRCGHWDGEDVRCRHSNLLRKKVLQRSKRVPGRKVAANLSPGQRAQPQSWWCHCVCPNFCVGTLTTPPQARCQKLQLEVGGHLPSLATCRFPPQATPKEGGDFHTYAGIGHFYTANRKVKKAVSDWGCFLVWK